MSDMERARAMLARWKAARGWARRGPEEAGLRGVEAFGPTRVVLRSVVELRDVRYALRPAPERPREVDPGPDPWALDLAHPEEAEVGARREEPLPHLERHMDCAVCSAQGELACPDCNGKGYIRVGRRQQLCYRCQGRGLIVCVDCGGSGGLFGSPTACSWVEAEESVRVVEGRELPVEVLLAVQDEAGEGRVLHAQEGPRVEALAWPEAGRDAVRLREEVAALIAAPDLPRRHRLLRQRLEIQRPEVFQLSLEGGGEAWVYGDPPAVWPERALESAASKLARVAPWAALGLGLVGAVAYLVLG